MEDSHFDIFLGLPGAYGSGTRPFGPFGYLYDVLGYGNGVNGAYWQGGLQLDTDSMIFLAGIGMNTIAGWWFPPIGMQIRKYFQIYGMVEKDGSKTQL